MLHEVWDKHTRTRTKGLGNIGAPIPQELKGWNVKRGVLVETREVLMELFIHRFGMD